jgi:hypothetical protein
MESFKCSQGNTGPILDVTAAGFGGVMAVWAANQGHADSYFYLVSDELTAIGVTSAVLYGVSAFVGFNKTKKCREATQRLAEELVQMRPSRIDTLAVPPPNKYQ